MKEKERRKIDRERGGMEEDKGTEEGEGKQRKKEEEIKKERITERKKEPRDVREERKGWKGRMKAQEATYERTRGP